MSGEKGCTKMDDVSDVIDTAKYYLINAQTSMLLLCNVFSNS